MYRKGTLLRVVTWSTLAILILVAAVLLIHFCVTGTGATVADEVESKHPKVTTSLENLRKSRMQNFRTGNIGLAGAKNEVRSVPSPLSSSNTPSRPVYQKPKPKLVLPKQLQQQKQEPKSNQQQPKSGIPGSNPNLVTQTVYGFLDFVTTVGNTVMVFTPQTKKVEPSSSAQLRETVLLQPTQIAGEVVEETSESPKVSNQRSARLLEFDEEDGGSDGSLTPEVLESSEYEPKVFPTSLSSTPGSSSDLEYINLMADSSSSTPALKESSAVPVVTASPEVRTSVNVVTAIKTSESSSNSSSVTKGFTLKFSRPASQSQPTSTPKTSVIVTAERKSTKNEFPTGLVSHNLETKISNGVTTVHETKVIGTFIGTQYARILESSSSVLPFVVTASRAPPTTTTKTPTTTPKKVPKFLDTMPEGFEFSTQRSVTSSGDMENDERFNEELLENEEGPDETLGLDDSESESAVIPIPTPTVTATASEESTHYVLPQKDQTAQIYASPVPSPNAYSRQPQIYVDVSPVNAYDYAVTATPSRKPFRPQNPRSSESTNRFTNRFNKNPSTSTESNELTLSYESTSDENSRRAPSRFRNNNGNSNTRNRAGFKSNKQTVEPEIYPTPAISAGYGNAVTATSARKFNRGRNNGAPPAKNGQEFKLGGRNSNSGASRLQHAYITPTSSTSIYKFKLNRPTGRWRFKPSPKPKVNIIRTKEEEDLAKQKELLQVSTSNGAVYPQGYNEQGEVLEIQNAEETRTESNELGQELEPELVPQTIRVATVTPTEFSDFENSRIIEIATIRSPYVFQAGNVKNTRYITVTKTFTKEMIQPTQASASFGEPTLENILATRAPFERILEGSNIATFPLIILGSDTATPPLETVTQTFSTMQLMLKTSILPVLYEGVTTLYTLTQSYFITRLVTAHKTIPPMELFHFVPTKSLTEFNTALQEAGTEHREQLLGSETSENDAANAYANIVAPPDELTGIGSDFDPSAMDEKFPRNLVQKNPKALAPPPPLQKPKEQLPDFSNLTPDQLAFLRYFASAGQAQQLQPAGLIPMQNPLQNFFQSPLLPSIQPQYQAAGAAPSPIVLNTVATIVETKTLRIQFGSKPTHTIIYSTKIVPTRVTSYAPVPVPSTPAIQNFFQPHPFAYVG